MPVDEFDLELLEAGAELSPERISAVQQDATLDPARNEIAQIRSWWATHRPALPVRAPVSTPNRWVLWGTALAIAATVLLVVGPMLNEHPYRAMGEPEIDLLRIRAGLPVESTEAVRAADQLSVSLVPEETRYVTVATLQEDGAVSLLVVSERIPAGSRFELPGRMVLDGYAGREWLVVSTAAESQGSSALDAELRALLPEPSAHESAERWVIEITRGQTPR